MNILMVVANNGFRDPEAIEPKKILEDNGIKVTISALEAGSAVGDEGTVYNVDVPVADVKVEDYNGVAFIGGPDMAGKVNEPAHIDLARKFYDAGKLTTAICVAPAIFAHAGIVDGKTVTSWGGVKSVMSEAGGQFSDEGVLVDGTMITAAGPHVAQEYGEAILKALG
ncbi:MAG: DJ-1/PfpI family protein [Patescibacteria group bacterium]|nr:DJ-1/PfpI family protein [Patescibacteria group bacterium]